MVAQQAPTPVNLTFCLGTAPPAARPVPTQAPNSEGPSQPPTAAADDCLVQTQVSTHLQLPRRAAAATAPPAARAPCPARLLRGAA